MLAGHVPPIFPYTWNINSVSEGYRFAPIVSFRSRLSLLQKVDLIGRLSLPVRPHALPGQLPSRSAGLLRRPPAAHLLRAAGSEDGIHQI